MGKLKGNIVDHLIMEHYNDFSLISIHFYLINHNDFMH